MELSVFIQSCYFRSLMFMNCSYIIIYYIGNLFLEDRSWNILKNSAIYAEMWITPSVPAIAYLKRISWILQLLVCVLVVAYQKKAGADRLIKKISISALFHPLTSPSLCSWTFDYWASSDRKIKLNSVLPVN